MPRLRELGLRIGDLDAGPSNSIADVGAVTVGHVTVWRDEPVVRTGVTAIVPARVDGLFREPIPAGVAVLNGAGELTGSLQIREWGTLDTSVYLASTMAVGRVFDGAVAVAIEADPAVGVDDVVIPVVGECDDSWLSDARTVHVEAEDAGRAVAAATAEVAEGAVGAGTGMVAFGRKAGIGTASRLVPDLDCTVGVLVLANFGFARELRVDGVPVGRLLDAPVAERPPRPAGSCIVVGAIDAPLGPHQLERVARRAGLGLARTGSTATHGSGEIFLAFATEGRRAREERRARIAVDVVPDAALNPLFTATVDATEEAVLNALWAAPSVTGRDGHVAPALPHDDLLELLSAYRRLAP
ncbi:MAG TPA: P1 family peptidase [Gaiellaceae bacterium]